MNPTPTRIILGKPGGTWTNLTPYVRNIEIGQEPVDPELLRPIALTRTVSVRFRVKISPAFYRYIQGRRHPRIARMHRQYRLKRGKR